MPDNRRACCASNDTSARARARCRATRLPNGNRSAVRRCCATAGPSGAAPPQGGTLKVVTTNLSEGWLRKNGVAYSESATLLEYWDRVAFPNGDVWLIVTSVVSDPRYLLNDYTTSMHFKREAGRIEVEARHHADVVGSQHAEPVSSRALRRPARCACR